MNPTILPMYHNPLWVMTEKYGWGLTLFYHDYGRHMNGGFLIRCDDGIPRYFDTTEVKIEGDLSRHLPEPNWCQACIAGECLEHKIHDI